MPDKLPTLDELNAKNKPLPTLDELNGKSGGSQMQTVEDRSGLGPVAPTQNNQAPIVPGIKTPQELLQSLPFNMGDGSPQQQPAPQQIVQGPVQPQVQQPVPKLSLLDQAQTLPIIGEGFKMPNQYDWSRPIADIDSQGNPVQQNEYTLAAKKIKSDIEEVIPLKNYVGGTLNTVEKSFGQLMYRMDGASKYISDATGGVLNHSGMFKDIGDSYTKSADDFLPMPENVPGKIMSGVSEVPVLILETWMAPELKIAKLGQLTNGVVNAVPKLGTVLGFNAFADSYAKTEGQDQLTRNLEAYKSFGVGAIEGSILHALGFGANKVGEMVGDAAKSPVLNATTSAVVNGLGFAGLDVAHQYEQTGKVNWDNVVASFGSGVALGIPQISIMAGQKALDNFMTASPELLNKVTEIQKTPEELRNDAIDNGSKVSEAPDDAAKNELLLKERSLNTLADIKGIMNIVSENPEGFKKIISSDAQLTDAEKQFYNDKIDQVYAEAHTPKEVRGMTDEIKSHEESISNIQDNKFLSDQVKEVLINDRTDKINQINNNIKDSAIEYNQKRLGLPVQPEILLSDAAQKTYDAIKKKKSIILESDLDGLSKELYSQYKALGAIKESSTRKYSRSQIDSKMEELGGQIKALEDAKVKMVEDDKSATVEFPVIKSKVNEKNIEIKTDGDKPIEPETVEGISPEHSVSLPGDESKKETGEVIPDIDNAVNSQTKTEDNATGDIVDKTGDQSKNEGADPGNVQPKDQAPEVEKPEGGSSKGITGGTADGAAALMTYDEFKQKEIERLGAKHSSNINEELVKKRYDKYQKENNKLAANEKPVAPQEPDIKIVEVKVEGIERKVEDADGLNEKDLVEGIAEVDEVINHIDELLGKSDDVIARIKGEKTVDGTKYVRQEPIPKLEGKPTEIIFGKDEKQQGNYVIVERKYLQPSHKSGVVNELNFIPEAQPRDRGALDVLKNEAKRKADSLNPNELVESPNAFFGAPVVNERGELIQGNGRTEAIDYYYLNDKKDSKGYKQKLNDSAESLGIDKEQMAKMEEPVLVRMIKVSDEKAIELGNSVSSDLEDVKQKGADQKAAVNKLSGEKSKELMDLIQSNADENSTLKSIIRENAKAIIDKLIKIGVIRADKKESYINQDGVTPQGIEEVENIFRASLFSGGKNDLQTRFDALPFDQRTIIEKSLPSILSREELRTKTQKVIEALYEYNVSGAKSFSEWTSQGDMFAKPKTKEFSKNELALAKEIADAKNQKSGQLLFKKIAEEIGGTPADMFSPAKEAKKFEELQIGKEASWGDMAVDFYKEKINKGGADGAAVRGVAGDAKILKAAGDAAQKIWEKTRDIAQAVTQFIQHIKENFPEWYKQRKEFVEKDLREFATDKFGSSAITIEQTQKQNIKAKLKAVASAIKDTIKEGKLDKAAFSKQIMEIFNATDFHGDLAKKQAGAILNRGLKVDSEIKLNAFMEYADRVMDDVNYITDLNTAKELSGKIKAKAKSDKTLVNNKDLLDALGRLPVKDISDLKAYNELAQEYLNSQLPVTNKAYRPFDNSKAEKYLETVQKELDKKYIQSIEEKYDMAGLNKEDAKTIDEFFESEKEDAYLDKLTDAKRKDLNDRLHKIAEYSKIGLEDADFSGFSDRGKGWIETMKNADLSLLNEKDLKDYIRTADNAVVNNTNANIGMVAAIIKGKENAIAAKKIEGIKTLDVNKFEKLYNSLPLILKKVFGTSEKVAKVRLLTGIEDVFNGGSKTNNLITAVEKEYKKFKKENKVSSDSENIIARGIYSYLIQHSGGSVTEINGRLENNKNKVQQSIDVYANTKSKKNIAEVAQKVFDRFEDLKTIDEVKTAMEKLYPADKKSVEFWQDAFEKKKEEIRENTEAFHNEKFDDEYDYTPYTMRLVNRSMEKVPDEVVSFQREDMPFKPKQAPTTLKRSKSQRLPEGWAVDFDFDTNMLRKYQKSQYDVKTSESRTIFREFMKTKDGVDFFGGIDNANNIVKVFNDSEMMQRNAGVHDTDVGEMINGITTAARNISTSIALGGFTQWLKQYPSVGLGTLIRLGADAPLFLQSYQFAKNNPIFDGFTISERAAREGGYDKGEVLHNKLNRRLGESVVSKVGSFVEDASAGVKKVLFTSLREGDVSIAKRSWISYYLQSLKKQGVDISKIDAATEYTKLGEPERKLAAAYAEQVVKETQIPSNPAEISQLQKASGSAAQRTLKDIFLPFSTFSANMRGRMINDVIRLKTGTNSDRIEAGKDLIATIGETAAFHAISVAIIGGIIYPAGKQILYSLFGLDEKKKTEAELKAEMEFKLKKWYSNVSRDMVASGFGTIAENNSIDGMNRVAYWISTMNDLQDVKDKKGHLMTYKEYTEANPLFYRYNKKDGTDFGLYQILLDKPKEISSDIEGVIDGTNTQNYFGKDITKKLNEDQQDYMTFMLCVDMLSVAGVMDADLYRMAQQSKREIELGKLK